MSKNLVIVESPAKAHTIEKYLGSDFTVLASVGHIRKDTKVDKNTFDVTYEIDPGHKSVITDLKKAAKAADKIWLATDEDREGEAISWHLCEVLKLPKDTARITFHEITKTALEDAIKNPRTVDMNMVASQQARQTLDMLVGFDLSGIVRKKVPGAVSAGRVQSPALRLVVEREQAIEKFASKFSYKVSGDFGFDMNMHVLKFKPGASHGYVETHFQEHGMLFLQGKGMYRLGDDWMPLQKGDYVFMDSYCPQCCYAVGTEDYIYIYSKDCNRDVQL